MVINIIPATTHLTLALALASSHGRYSAPEQWVRLGFDPFMFMTITVLEKAEAKPGKHSDT